jgi:hypothetical protein
MIEFVNTQKKMNILCLTLYLLHETYAKTFTELWTYETVY